MFDDITRELQRLESGVQISIDMQLDDDGYFDRICPNPECGAEFKVLFEDWSDKVSDEVVYCPICRVEAESSEWNTPEQQNYIKQAAKRYIQQKLNKAITKSTHRFNRTQPKGGFITISMSYRPSMLPILIPAEASEIMRQRSTCEKCSCQYSSLGAAFFCPACGHNSAGSTFFGTVVTVRKTLDTLPTIRQALTEATDKDTAEDSVRHICENGLVRLVAAFQRFSEALFDALPIRANFNPRRNLFQNLSESNDLWRSAVGDGYEDILNTSEISDLNCFFQQRHLLAHKEGIVDQMYIDKSGDNRYEVGQRLVIRMDSVQYLADLVSKLGDELRKRV